MTMLFYAPAGADPVVISEDRFEHPDYGTIFGVQPDPARDIYELEFEVTEPDSRIATNTPTYALNPAGTHVRMAWDSQLKPISQLYQARLAELRALVKTKFKLTRDLGGVPADEDVFALTALAHQARIISGNTDPQDEYQFLRSDGEIATRTAANVESFVRNLSRNINDVGDQYEVHKAALQTLRDATDRVGVVEYDITTGWPT